MDDFLSMFPSKLAKQMRAAGVTGPSSLVEILQENPALDREFTRYAEKHPEVIITLTMSALMEQFLLAEDPAELLGVYLAAPPEVRGLLPLAVAQVADSFEQDGNTEEAEDLRERLDELHKMVETLNSPVIVALTEFMKAPDEVTARYTYERHRRVLQTIQAQRMLDSDDLLAASPAPAELEARRELLRELRARGSAYAPRHRLHRG